MKSISWLGRLCAVPRTAVSVTAVVATVTAITLPVGAQTLPETIGGTAVAVDGDTIDLTPLLPARGPVVRVRLWGIEAPEGDQTCNGGGPTPVWPCGKMALAILSSTLQHASRVACTPQGYDKYQRIVGQCLAVIDGAPVDLGRVMTRTGWALDAPAWSRTYYHRDQEHARARKNGIHASTYISPAEWRQGAR